MLIVFDLDGTLVDSRRDLADAANALIAERGGRPLAVETIASMVGEGAALLVRRALAAADIDAGQGEGLARFLELYDERLLVHTRLYDGVREVLTTLRRKHRLAVLTNKPVWPTRKILSGLNVLDCFEEVYGGDGPHPRKPDPAGLIAMVAAAGSTSADAVLVGDSKIDIATARAANTGLCVARYGFGFHQEEMLLRPGELCVDAPRELITMFAGR